MTDIGDYTNPRKITITPGNVQISSITTPSDEQSDQVIITYVLQSDQSETASIVPTFSIDGSDPTTVAKNGTGGEGLTGLATSPDGVTHTFAWDSLDATEGITSIAREVSVLFKIIPKDASGSVGTGMTTGSFITDNLPIAPTYDDDSFINDYKTEDTTPTFVWTVPTDPGVDQLDGRLSFSDDISFLVNEEIKSSDNTTDNPIWATTPGALTFEYKVLTTTAKTHGDFFIRNQTVIAEGGTAFTFAGLTDSITGSVLPTNITDPQIMVVPKNGRMVYQSAKSGTGFTLNKSEFGDSADAVVDIFIFDGTTAWDEYWIENFNVTSKSAVSVLFSSFGADANGTVVATTIINPIIAVMNQKDRMVIVENISNTGFDVREAAMGAAIDGQVTIMIMKDSTDIYCDRDVAVTNKTVSSSTPWSSFTDDTDAGAALPSQIPGAMCILLQKKDRMVNSVVVSDFGLRLTKAQSGSDTDGSVDVIVFGAAVGAGIWIPVPLEGIADTHEGVQMRFTLLDADALSQGIFFWRVAAGN